MVSTGVWAKVRTEAWTRVRTGVRKVRTARLFAGAAAVVAFLLMAAPAYAAQDVTVEVERQAGKAVTDRLTSYDITVENSGDEPVDVTVRVTVPRRMQDVTVTGGNRTSDGVEWTMTVPAGQPATMVLTGVYRSAPPSDRAVPHRVALTACVLIDGERLVSCDTDIAELTSPGWLTRWWWLAIPLAVALAAWQVRRWRRPTVEPGQWQDLDVDLGELEPPGEPAGPGRRTWLPRPAARPRPR